MYMSYRISVFLSADNQLIDQLTSEKKILNIEFHIFRPDHYTKIRSRLSITVLQKKKENWISLKKKWPKLQLVTFNFSDAEEKLLMRAAMSDWGEGNMLKQENETLWREKWNLIDDNIRLSGRLTNLEEEKVILLL